MKSQFKEIERTYLCKGIKDWEDGRGEQVESDEDSVELAVAEDNLDVFYQEI